MKHKLVENYEQKTGKNAGKVFAYRCTVCLKKWVKDKPTGDCQGKTLPEKTSSNNNSSEKTKIQKQSYETTIKRGNLGNIQARMKSSNYITNHVHNVGQIEAQKRSGVPIPAEQVNKVRPFIGYHSTVHAEEIAARDQAKQDPDYYKKRVQAKLERKKEQEQKRNRINKRNVVVGMFLFIAPNPLFALLTFLIIGLALVYQFLATPMEEMTLEDEYDYYDVNLGDDISLTDLTGEAAANFIIPVPYDLDFNSCLKVMAIRIKVTDAAIDGIIQSVAEASEVAESIRIHWFYFKPTQTDETTQAYREEMKQAICMHELYYRTTVAESTGDYATDGVRKLYHIIKFKNGIIFPLNPAIKIMYNDEGTGAVFDALENLECRIYYKKVKNPLDYLGKILGLLQTEIDL